MSSLKESIKYLVLQEVSRGKYEDFIDNLPDRPLPFDNDLFGGSTKKRVIVPFISNLMKEIGAFLEKEGYQVDLERGITIKTIQTQRGSKNVETKIGKTLNLEYDRLKKETKDFFKYFEEVDPKTLDFTDYSFEDKQRLRNTPHYSFRKDSPFYRKSGMSGYTASELTDLMKRIAHEPRDEHEASLQSIIQNEDLLQKVDWFAEVEQYIKKYNKEGTGFSYVVSRSPIDVLRMSDFEGIQSCHSEGGSYWKCAVQEGKTGGAVVYLVKNDSLKEIDLEKEEIFKDDDRGVPGIIPLSRIRLRRFVNKSEDYDLAVPEIRSYGAQIPGFLEGITRWAFDKQKYKFQIPSEDPEDKEGFYLEQPDLEDFVLVGGSYRDNDASRLFNNFFQTSHYRGDTDVESEDESQDLIRQYEEECQEMLESFEVKAKHVYASFEVQDEDQHPWVSYIGGISIKLPQNIKLSVDLSSVSYQFWMRLEHHLKHHLEHHLKHHSSVYGLGDYQYHRHDNSISFYIESDSEPNPDGFGGFLYDLISDYDDKYSVIYMSILSFFKEEGILLEDSHISEFLKILDENPFTNIEDVEYDEDTITFDVEYGIPFNFEASNWIFNREEYLYPKNESYKNYNDFIRHEIKQELPKKLQSIMKNKLAQMFIPGLESFESDYVPSDQDMNGFYVEINFHEDYGKSGRFTKIVQPGHQNRYNGETMPQTRYDLRGSELVEPGEFEEDVSRFTAHAKFRFVFNTTEQFNEMNDLQLKSILNFMKYFDSHYDDLKDMLENIILKALWKHKIIIKRN